MIFENAEGDQIRMEFYENAVVRVRRPLMADRYLPDNHYPMVEQHIKTGKYYVSESDDQWIVYVTSDKGQQFTVTIDKTDLTTSWRCMSLDRIILEQMPTPDPEKIRFRYQEDEHFCGLGHPAYGQVEKVDLKGRVVDSNYGSGKEYGWGPQGVLTVPFFISSFGYGIFLNSSFPHAFSFGAQGIYSMGIASGGKSTELDYFFIYGPDIREVLNRYTTLTGKPRLPQRSIFGLQLSDKGYPENAGATWWKAKINAHREAGFPLDHIVNDNRWRAGSGAWSGSRFEWDEGRYSDPAAWAKWCRNQGLTVTLDLNRNIAKDCKGWEPEFNIPLAAEYVKEGDATPDYTNPVVRNWLWTLFWNASFDPALGYPGDGIWIDETDELFTLPDTINLANGRTWRENANLYQYYVALAAVGEGWDNSNDNLPPGIGVEKRPYVWIRGMSAGGQRLATYWTGDLPCSYSAMKGTVRGMLAAGMSGFPYFNHDAGGFRDGPDDPMYMQWAMGLGSLSPIWRPHGYGENKRWPLDRSADCQEAAARFGKFRYTRMPYLYSLAHEANRTGTPMARPMFLEHQHQQEAWETDLQYYWGPHMLVAPSYCGVDTTITVWLPPGSDWYDLWTHQVHQGGQKITVHADPAYLPVFIKSGAIIPGHPYVLTTADMRDTLLVLDVYPGSSGEFNLFEDDGVSGRYAEFGEVRTTHLEYEQSETKVTIHPTEGTYREASEQRSYIIRFHVDRKPQSALLEELDPESPESRSNGEYTELDISWSGDEKCAIVRTGMYPVNMGLRVFFIP